MKIDLTGQHNNKNIKYLIFKTVIIIISIILFFNVLYLAGQSLHDYAIKRIYSTFLSEDEFDKKIDFSGTYYSSAIYSLNEASYSHYISLELGNGCVYKVEFISEDISNYIVIDAKSSEYSKYLYLIPDYISEKGFSKIIVTPIYGASGFWVKNLVLYNKVFSEKFQEYKIVDIPIKNISIEIDKNDLENIAQNRANALRRGILLEEDSIYYPAKIIIEGKTSQIQMRLKGDWVDHLATDKWSFRIEMKEDSAWGMVKFSIQSPEARNGIGEYLIQNLYDHYQGVSLNYDYAHVIINGEYWGVYAVEQAFDKIAVENSLKREGPIIKFDESYLWERYAYYDSVRFGIYSYAPFDVFSLNKTVKNEKLYAYSKYAIELLKGYRAGQIEAEDVFDMEIYTKYLAICDAFRANHAIAWHNRRYYFNPVTAKLEPITFDMMTMNPEYTPTSLMFQDFFLNEDFSKVYIDTLLDIVGNYDSFLSSLQPELNQYIDLIDMYNYEDVLSEHRRYILNTINSDNSEFLLSENESGKFIAIKSNSILAIYITDVLYKNESILDQCRVSKSKISIDNIDNYDLNMIELEYFTIYNHETNKKSLIISDNIMEED